MKIKLEHPVAIEGGTKIDTVTLRRPKVSDIRAAQKSGAADEDIELALIANLSGLAPETIYELDFADYCAVQEALSGFRKRSKSAA